MEVPGRGTRDKGDCAAVAKEDERKFLAPVLASRCFANFVSVCVSVSALDA